MTTPPEVLVIGSVNADLVVRVPHHPRPGETVLGADLVVHPGGKGANQAVAAARLGARVAFAGRVGSDAYGPMLLDSLRGAGVDTALVGVSDGASGVAMITVDDAGENAIAVSPGANATVLPAAMAPVEAVLAAVPVVVTQLEIPDEAVDWLLRLGRAHGTRVVVNPSPGPWRTSDDNVAACDPLVVNRIEAAEILGLPSFGATPDEALASLRAWRDRPLRPKSVVVTLGGDGAVLFDGAEEPVHVPAAKVAPVDTTGAGDAFTGALAWRLARGDGLADAVRLAVRVGAAATTRAGAQSSYPTLAELAERAPENAL
jgi:ribokinase